MLMPAGCCLHQGQWVQANPLLLLLLLLLVVGGLLS
jgi:hypothetical protein